MKHLLLLTLSGIWLSSLTLQAQSIQSIMPASAKKGEAFPVTITGTGTNWQMSGYYSYINFLFSGNGVYASSEYVIDPTHAGGWLGVDFNAPAGSRDVTVSYTDGATTQNLTLPGGFTVRESSLLSCNPNNGDKGAAFPVTITGLCTNWQSAGYNISVSFSGGDVSASNVNVVDTNVVTCDVAIDNNAIAGPRSVFVNYHNRVDSLSQGFTVNPSMISMIAPDSSLRSESVAVTITGVGTNWQAAGSINFINLTGAGTAFSNVTITNPTTINATLDVGNNAETGWHDLAIQYDNGTGKFRTDNLMQAFKVIPSRLVSITPNKGQQGATVPVMIEGMQTNWKAGGTYAVTFSGSGVMLSNPVFDNATTIKGDVVVDPTAALGLRDVIVVYDDGSGVSRSDTLQDGFEVEAGTGIGEPVGYDVALRAFPNPFKEEVVLGFYLQDRRAVTLEVYNVLGDKVATLVDGVQQPGHYQVPFVAGGDGVYLVKLQVGGKVYSKVVVSLK